MRMLNNEGAFQLIKIPPHCRWGQIISLCLYPAAYERNIWASRRKGIFWSMWGVASNSLLHVEQVVNNESSLMVSSVNAIWKKSRSGARSRGGWCDALSGATLLLTQGYDMLICLPLGPTRLLLGFITHSCSSVTSKSALNEKWNKKTLNLIRRKQSASVDPSQDSRPAHSSRTRPTWGITWQTTGRQIWASLSSNQSLEFLLLLMHTRRSSRKTLQHAASWA